MEPIMLELRSSYPLNPQHGLHAPMNGTPARRPGSIRRTSSLDVLRTAEAPLDVQVRGAARDLLTATDGTTMEVDSASLTAHVDASDSYRLLALQTAPSRTWEGVIGQSAMGGFRGRMAALAPDVVKADSALHTLLDDVPVGILVSGQTLLTGVRPGHMIGMGYQPIENQCAGFVTGGTLMSGFKNGQSIENTGPNVEPLPDPQDPIGWHHLEALPRFGMRRIRRLDAWRGADPHRVEIDAAFRDFHIRADDVAIGIHEYHLSATVQIDPGGGPTVLIRGVATPHILPWQECPAAVASAGRVVGMALDEVRTRVRAESTGTSTCTHLNDMLRSLGGAAALIPHLTASSSTPRRRSIGTG